MFLWMMWATLAAAQPDKAVTAEVRRIGEEMVSHASAGRRQPLQREYRNLLALTSEISPELHVLAADAALAEGEVAEAVARYQRVPSDAAQAARVADVLADIATRYGTVRLSGTPGTELTAAMRFNPEELAAVSHAREVVEKSGVFVGLLPSGAYGLDGKSFEVKPGEHVSAQAGTRSEGDDASPPTATKPDPASDAEAPEGETPVATPVEASEGEADEDAP